MLQQVDPRYVSDVWGWVRDGLNKILDKTQDDWQPEDVYAEIRGGASTLYIIDDGSEHVGFVVTQFWPAYQAGPRLFIRALWGIPHKLAPMQADLIDDLKALARKHGARGLRMTSPRRWDAAGWTMKQYIYEMEV